MPEIRAFYITHLAPAVVKGATLVDMGGVTVSDPFRRTCMLHQIAFHPRGEQHHPLAVGPRHSVPRIRAFLYLLGLRTIGACRLS